MSKLMIIMLILKYSTIMGIDPHIALAVAKVESNFNPNIVGSIGEIGLFQVRPEYVKGFTRDELFNPHTNIIVGINKIKEVQNACRHVGSNIDYIVCYNVGVTGGKRMRNPRRFSYMKKIYKVYNKSIVSAN